MRYRNALLCVCATLVAVGVISWVRFEDSAEARGRGRSFRYEVTLTNLTRGQVLSPGVLAAHTARMAPIFMGGQPASEELAAVAEDAVLAPLLERLEASDHVETAVVLASPDGPIPPGSSATVMIETSARASRISLVGMLVTTNDAFYGLNAARAPVAPGASSWFLSAYDAGSEANNELCSHIPGPPCGNAGVRDTEGAEGFVHVHAGIQGVGDLDPAAHDWRNPVAKVTVRRVVPHVGSDD